MAAFSLAVLFGRSSCEYIDMFAYTGGNILLI